MSSVDSYRDSRFETVTLNQRHLQVATRPALRETTGVSVSEELLSAEATLTPGQRVLVAPCGRGALAGWAAGIVGAPNVLAVDTNAISLELTRATLAANGLDGALVATSAASRGNGQYDVGLMVLPKGRALARLHLLNIALALKPGALLYLAGAKDEGIKSVLGDAATLLGTGQLLAYRKGHRVAGFVRPDVDLAHLPEPFALPGLLPGTYSTYAVEWHGRRLTVCSRPGVFSHGELDPGTAMLLAHLRARRDDRVLDWGCGSGVIGLVAALQAPPETVTLLDVDALACECAVATLAANSVAGARVVHGDGLAALAGERYSLIVSNPPFHSGRAVNLRLTEALIAEARAALLPRGRLLLVANRFLPYDHLLRDRFASVETVVQDNFYRVLEVVR